jgi:hypothetical protein
MVINSYRNFRREREREFDKIIEGFTPKEDKEFESMCNRYLSNEIQISDFDNYLNRSLFLDINESINNFDEYGNLINEELEWLNKAIGYVKDKSNAAFNVAISFFESIISKVKKFIKSLTKFVTDKDKMMELLSSFVDKVMSGLKYFGDFLKKNKKGLYSLLVKVCVSLGITATVSYLLSFFGPGWVVAMSAKTGASAVSQKLKVGDKIASKVVRNESSKIKNYSEFINEAEESKVKKVASLLGKGIINFFKILKKFKIAVLIFLGAIWIIGHIFSPFGNFLDPIFEATQMTSLSDVFKTDFVTSASSIPSVKVNSEVAEINIKGVKMPTLNSEDDLGVNEIQTSSTEQLDTQVSGIKGEILENPKEFCEAQSKLINELKSQIVGEESKGIVGVDTDNANELTQDQVEQTTGADVGDLTTHQGGCFVSGTLVTLSNGESLNIEDVKEGDMVITYNIEKNIQEIGKVKSLISLKKNDIVSIKLSNSTNVECTSEHPFWVVNKGWSSISPEKSLLYHDMNIEKMTVGDILLTDSNIGVIVDDIKELKNETINVYNLQIEGHHNYYANGILVHNKMAFDGDDDEPRGGIFKNLKKTIKDKSDEIKGNIKDKVLGSKEDPSNVNKVENININTLEGTIERMKNQVSSDKTLGFGMGTSKYDLEAAQEQARLHARAAIANKNAIKSALNNTPNTIITLKSYVVIEEKVFKTPEGFKYLVVMGPAK